MELSPEQIDAVIPRILPPGWTTLIRGGDGAKFANKLLRLSVIVSVGIELDGKPWLHVSVAGPDGLPSWDTLMMVKEMFIGKERYAYQVLPPRAKHVNIHPHCLHLFYCLTGPVLPDFTQGGNTL